MKKILLFLFLILSIWFLYNINVNSYEKLNKVTINKIDSILEKLNEKISSQDLGKQIIFYKKMNLEIEELKSKLKFDKKFYILDYLNQEIKETISLLLDEYINNSNSDNYTVQWGWSKCGDWICDNKEKLDSNICPTDCKQNFVNEDVVLDSNDNVKKCNYTMQKCSNSILALENPEDYWYCNNCIDINKNSTCGNEFRVFQSNNIQDNPDVFDNKIVWIENVDWESVIYLKDLSNNNVKIITSSENELNGLKIYNDLLVWVDMNNNNNSKECLTSEKTIDPNCNIDIIVYDIKQKEIVVNLGEDTEKAQWLPDIYEDIIVWEDYRDENADVYMYSNTTWEVLLADTSADSTRVRIDGDIVVRQDTRNIGTGRSNRDVYWLNINDKIEHQLIPNHPNSILTESQRKPDISGNIIVYEDATGNDKKIDGTGYGSKVLNVFEVWDELFSYNIETGENLLLTNELYGDQGEPFLNDNLMISIDFYPKSDVYSLEELENTSKDNLDRDSVIETNIFLRDIYTLETTQLTPDPSDQWSIKIENNTVVRVDNRHDVNQIYGYIICK